MDECDGRQFVGIDLHRQRSVIVRQSESGEPSPLPRPDDPIDPDRTIGRLTRTPVPVGKHRYRLASCIDGC